MPHVRSRVAIGNAPRFSEQRQKRQKQIQKWLEELQELQERKQELEEQLQELRKQGHIESESEIPSNSPAIPETKLVAPVRNIKSALETLETTSEFARTKKHKEYVGRKWPPRRALYGGRKAPPGPVRGANKESRFVHLSDEQVLATDSMTDGGSLRPDEDGWFRASGIQIRATDLMTSDGSPKREEPSSDSMGDLSGDFCNEENTSSETSVDPPKSWSAVEINAQILPPNSAILSSFWLAPERYITMHTVMARIKMLLSSCMLYVFVKNSALPSGTQRLTWTCVSGNSTNKSFLGC